MSGALAPTYGVSKARTQHLDDPETRRDLFGVVRGACTACRSCACYWKRTSEYEGKVGAPHPHNNPSIMMCSRCGCSAEDHLVDLAEDAKEKGNDAMAFGEIDEAIRYYTVALEHAPREATHYSNRAAAYLEKKWYKQALHDADHSLSLRPDWAKPRARKAHALLMMGRAEEAVKEMKRCVELDGNNPNYRKMLRDAEAKHRIQKMEARKTTHSRKISKQPSDGQDAQTYKELGDKALNEGKADEAVRWYTAAIRTGSEDPKLWSNRSAAHGVLEKFDAALADACRAIDLKPEWHKAWCRKGYALYHLARYESSLEAYSHALKLDPENSAAMDGIAKAKEAAIRQLGTATIKKSFNGRNQAATCDQASGNEKQQVNLQGMRDEVISPSRLQSILQAGHAHSATRHSRHSRHSQHADAECKEKISVEATGKDVAGTAITTDPSILNETSTQQQQLQHELLQATRRCRQLEDALMQLEKAHHMILQELSECKTRLSFLSSGENQTPLEVNQHPPSECNGRESSSSPEQGDSPKESILERIARLDSYDASELEEDCVTEDQQDPIPQDVSSPVNDSSVDQQYDTSSHVSSPTANHTPHEVCAVQPEVTANLGQRIDRNSMAALFRDLATKPVQEFLRPDSVEPSQEKSPIPEHKAHLHEEAAAPQCLNNVSEVCTVENNEDAQESMVRKQVDSEEMCVTEELQPQYPVTAPGVSEQMHATKMFFEAFMAEHASDTEEDLKHEADYEQDSWWDAWEEMENHRAAVDSRKNFVESFFTGKQKRRIPQTGQESLNSGLTVQSLQEMLEKPIKPKHARDRLGIARVACKVCSGRCMQYLPLRESQCPSSELLENHPTKFLRWAACYEEDICSTCGCCADEHETIEDAKRRESAMARSQRLQELLHQKKQNQRLARVEAARRRREDAESNQEILEETQMDGLQHQRRGQCGSCHECPGFCIWYRPSSTDPTDTEVMFYCSLCGCSAVDHVIDAVWVKEERLRQEEEARQQEARASSSRKYHKHRQTIIDNEHRRKASLDILGLPPTATSRDISRAYRRLALLWHPDKHAGDVTVAQSKFIQVTEAFRHLSQE